MDDVAAATAAQGTAVGGVPASAEDEVARVSVELAVRAADATPFGDLALASRDVTRVQPLLEEVLRSVADILAAPMAAMWLFDPVEQEFYLQCSLGLDADAVAELALRPGVGACGVAVAERRRIVVPDVRNSEIAHETPTAQALGWRAMVSTPMLTLAREPMGTLAAYFPDVTEPGERELRLVETYARQAAEMVERARMHAEARQLAELESRRGAQLRALADCALAVSAADTLDDLLRLVTEAATAIIGCHQGVGTRLPHGWHDATTHVVLSDKYAAWRDYDVVPKGLGVLEYVTRENRPLRLTGEELVRHPDWRGLRDAPDHPPLPDYLAAPLIGRDGGNLGLIQLSHKLDETPFTPEDEAIVVQLAQMASSAIERLEALERERAARLDAEQAAALRLLLSDATAVFTASLEPEEIAARLVEVVVPRFAQLAGVTLLDEHGVPQPVALAHEDPDVQEEAWALAEVIPSRLDDAYGAGYVLRTGEPQLLPAVTEDVLQAAVRSPEHLERLRRVLLPHTLVVPLTARGRTLAALTLSRTTPYADRDVASALDLAGRAALALDNASRFAFEREVASSLQRSLLPRVMPTHPLLTAASRYLPGARGTRIGGDWYDLIEVDGGNVFLVVGDVMGRGVEAAAVMGQLRATVRAYALEGHPPATVLAMLDRVVREIDELHFTTCVVGLLDPAACTVSMASAGHLPPLVVDPAGTATLLQLDPGLPLGVGGGDFVEREVRLQPGSTVLLYTDGLVEDRAVSLDDGLERLRAAAGSAPARSAEELCDRLLRALGRDGEHDDDTALLAVVLAGSPGSADATVDLELAAVPASATAARHAVERLVQTAGVDAREVAALLVTELVANSARHAGGTVRVRATVRADVLLVEVLDGSDQLPLRRLAADSAESGRGLMLVDALADRWGAEPLPTGKRVWFELTLDRG